MYKAGKHTSTLHERDGLRFSSWQLEHSLVAADPDRQRSDEQMVKREEKKNAIVSNPLDDECQPQPNFSLLCIVTAPQLMSLE